jgi:protein involved in polysaccharide export with SLBB domain
VEEQRLREYAASLDAQIEAEAGRQVAGAIDPNSASTSAGAAVSQARAAVNRIRNMQPSGRIVLKLSPEAIGPESIPDLQLEDGDRFIVPRKPTGINVAGEVYNASTFLYQSHRQVRDYLRDAGGPSRGADGKRLFVIRADGSVVSKQYGNVEKATALPGDTVVMPPRLSSRNILRDAVTISTALSQVALGLSILALVR